MSLKRFYVGVKGIIREERGILLLKASKGHWDIPGGRIDDDEALVDTLKRELSEELPGSEVINIEGVKGAVRIPKDIDDDISLVLVYFLVDAKLPKEIQLSEEHEDYIWINSVEDIPEQGLNPEIQSILTNSARGSRPKEKLSLLFVSLASTTTATTNG